MNCGEITLIMAVICASGAALGAFLTCFDRVFIVESYVSGYELHHGFGLFLYCFKLINTQNGNSDSQCLEISDMKGEDQGADFGQFKDENLAAGVMIIFGGLASGGLAVMICIEVAGVLDYRNCIAIALNITFAAGALVCLIAGVIIMSALYAPSVQDPLVYGDSNTLLVIEKMVEPINDKLKVTSDSKSHVNWGYVMGWLALICAITAMILVGATYCCCASKESDSSSKKSSA